MYKEVQASPHRRLDSQLEGPRGALSEGVADFLPGRARPAHLTLDGIGGPLSECRTLVQLQAIRPCCSSKRDTTALCITEGHRAADKLDTISPASQWRWRWRWRWHSTSQIEPASCKPAQTHCTTPGPQTQLTGREVGSNQYTPQTASSTPFTRARHSGARAGLP